jgi:hypothetical protein
MMTLAASRRTLKPAPLTPMRTTQAIRTERTARPGFWLTLLRALSAAAA